MENRLVNQLTQNQQMYLSPKLVEFFKILQMPSLSLSSYIEEHLKENPLLELSNQQENTEEVPQAKEEHKREIYEYSNRIALTRNDGYLSNKKDIVTLRDFLRSQLLELDINPMHRKIVGFLIESIDGDGYFKESIKEISTIMKIPQKHTLHCLRIIQNMEPPGVGARDLKECLLIQLKKSIKINKEIELFIHNYFDLLIKKDFSLITKKTGLKQDQIRQIYKILRELNPKPGSSFGEDKWSHYITPDLIMRENEDQYIVEFNEESIPSVNISTYYKNLLNDPDSDQSLKNYIRKRYSTALAITKAIEQRKNTLLEIAKMIIKYQNEFFTDGYKHINPLTMKTVANKVNISESTVSRAVNGKYIQTPRGVIELKFFFSSNIERPNKSDVSSVSVKDSIKRIVFNEDRLKPYSDEQIRSILESEGIKIARRTITKYREDLSILNASLRKM